MEKKKRVKKQKKTVEKSEYTNLRSIVDLNRPFTIFFSGVENEGYLNVLYDMGIRNFLMSYEYLKGKGNRQLKAHPDIHLFIDSGAYTYINDLKYDDVTVEEWEEHIIKYLEWAERHSDSIFAIADLDLQYLVGYPKVKEWREKYFEPFMLRTGIPVCFIYHEDGEQVWEYMCKRYPYLGISMATDSTGLNDLRGLFKIAEKYNTLVQGMGSTNTKHLMGLPFYTVDSSVDGDSKVYIDTKYGLNQLTISELFNSFPASMVKQTSPTEYVIDTTETGMKTLTVDDSMHLVTKLLKAVVKHVVKKSTVKITDVKGNSVTCTTDHSIITLKDGVLVETKADELNVGDNLVTIELGDFCYYANETEIKSIEVINDGSAEVEVFDLSVEKYERFIANGILVHNTTWNIGLKYGEMSIWRENHMGRVVKKDFENRAFPYVRKYSRQFDLDLIREEDSTTLIQVNAWAFIEAEKYIQDRLKASMYWLKAKVQNNDLENLPDDFFPSPDVLRSIDLETAKKYALKMNINPDSITHTQPRVRDMTVFMNWDDEQYSEFHSIYLNSESRVLKQYHDFFVNRIVQTDEERIEDLVSFFSDCLTGKNETLLHEGTNFDKVVKEREEYITEDEFEEVDVGLEEINRLIPDIQLRLTSDEEGAPDIEALDEEIFNQTNVHVSRDEKGRITKGTSLRKMHKKVYSDKYPKFACDSCHLAQRCPEHKAGYACAFNEMFFRFDTRDMSDIISSMQGIVEFSMARMQRAMMAEVQNGGVPDPQVSQLMTQNMSMMNQLMNMYERSGSEVLRQTRVVRSDGSQETNTIIQNPQNGGILEQLFSNVENKKKIIDDDIIEAEIVKEE